MTAGKEGMNPPAIDAAVPLAGEGPMLSTEAILDGVTDGFLVLDGQWRIRYINAAGAAILAPLHGGRENLIGRDLWKLFPDLAGTPLDHVYRRAVSEQVTVHYTLFYPPLDSWFEIRAYPTGEGLSIYYLDITQRKRVEDQLAAERRILGLIASDAPLTQVLEHICRETERQSGDGMLCSILLLDESGQHLVSGAAPSLADDYNRAIDGLRIGPDVGSCGTAAYLREPVDVRDVQADVRWTGFRELAEAAGLRACCSRPILTGKGRLLGTIAMYYDRPHLPSAHDQSLIDLATHLAGIAIERRQDETALQAAAERLRATFSQAAVGIAVCALEGHFEEANPKFVELLGYPLEALQALRFADITHPDDLAETREQVGRLLAGEISDCALEKRYRRRDGEIFWSRTTVTLLRDRDGSPRKFIAAIEDITLKKRAEMALRERETELQALADTMPQLVWIADAEGGIYWYNRRWYEYTGATAEQMARPDGWHAMHDPQLLPQVVERWRRSLDTGEPFEMEFPLRGADGRFRTFLTRANPIRDADGGILRWFGTNTDLESIDRSRKALEEETRILDLVNTTGQALVSQLDLDALLQQVTDAATELSGAQFGAFFYNATSAEGDAYLLYTLTGAAREDFDRFGNPRATPLFGPTFRGEPAIRLDDVTRDPRYGRMGPHHGMPPGHLPVRSYLAVPVISRSGEVIGGLFFGHSEVGVFTERAERVVTGIAAQAAVAIDNARLYEAVKRGAQERERLLEAEQAARGEAERASLMKDEFLSTLSHELRTPLNAVLGWAQILQRGQCKPEDLSHGVDTIARNARAQAKLIDDLLDMSRIVSGKVRLDVQPTDLGQVVDAAMEAIRPSADARGLRLHRVVDPQASPVAGDPARLQQVVWNLLSNAVKFTPRGGSVNVVVARVASHVEITVSDSGAGISPDFLPFVFERFRQADSSIARAHGGLGLGLSIVRQLTELHGGSVHVESAGEGQGSTFVVRLPRAAQRPAGVPEADGAGESVAEPQVDLAGVRVLVVDDEADTRDVLRHLLDQYQAQVSTADSAAEALALVQDDCPDVMISDIGMPGTDGYELIRQIRRLPAERGGHVPALAMTAFARSQDRTMAMMAGYQAHVAKPFDVHELLATIASLVRRR
jgi:PAS domain S-box-containing protein